MRIKFGTEGWRGVIADDFTVANVKIVAEATARYLKEADPPGDPLVVVGHDCRMMSELFAERCSQVLNSYGYNVALCDRPTSTPALSCGIVTRKAKGGCVFTASHNPGIFHGIKFKPYYGGAAMTEITNAIEKKLYSKDGTAGGGGTTEQVDFVPDYAARLSRHADIERIQASGTTLVFDAMFGAAAGYFERLLPKMSITAIRQQRNPIFPGLNPEPIAEHMGPLIEASRGKALGISLDGDGDRLGAIDENGNFVDSHRIFAIVYKHLVEQRGKSGAVVRTVTTTRMIDMLAKKYGATCLVTPVGFKYISEKMLGGGVLMGGEESGGIGITENLPERDGVLTGLLLMEAMVVSGKTLGGLVDDLFAEFGPHWYDRIDAQFQREEMPALQELVGTLTPAKVGRFVVNEVNRVDGVLFELDGGRFLMLRASGTEPVVRIYAEADTPATAAELTSEGEQMLRRALS